MAGQRTADRPPENPGAQVGMRVSDEPMRADGAIRQKLANGGPVHIGTFAASAVDIGCRDAAIRLAGDVHGPAGGVGAHDDASGEFGADPADMSIDDASRGLDAGLIDRSEGCSHAVSALKRGEVMDTDPPLDQGRVGASASSRTRTPPRR